MSKSSDIGKNETFQKVRTDINVNKARKAHFARVTTWMFYLPGITYRAACVLGLVYAFQMQEGGGSCRMSLQSIEKIFNPDAKDKTNMKRILRSLLNRGYLIKTKNGNKPSTYVVDENKCIEVATANGWHEGL